MTRAWLILLLMALAPALWGRTERPPRPWVKPVGDGSLILVYAAEDMGYLRFHETGLDMDVKCALAIISASGLYRRGDPQPVYRLPPDFGWYEDRVAVSDDGSTVVCLTTSADVSIFYDGQWVTDYNVPWAHRVHKHAPSPTDRRLRCEVHGPVAQEVTQLDRTAVVVDFTMGFWARWEWASNAWTTNIPPKPERPNYAQRGRIEMMVFESLLGQSPPLMLTEEREFASLHWFTAWELAALHYAESLAAKAGKAALIAPQRLLSQLREHTPPPPTPVVQPPTMVSESTSQIAPEVEPVQTPACSWWVIVAVPLSTALCGWTLGRFLQRSARRSDPRA